MIEAKVHPPPPAFAARIARKAALIAEARAENRARRRDPARWRDPHLLWPLFARD